MVLELKPNHNRLYQRLQEAMQQGSEVQIRLDYGEFYGIPVYLDEEFVELLDVYVPAADHRSTENREDSYERTLWLIRLSEVLTIAFAIEHWSNERLEQLLYRSEAEE